MWAALWVGATSEMLGGYYINIPQCRIQGQLVQCGVDTISIFLSLVFWGNSCAYSYYINIPKSGIILDRFLRLCQFAFYMPP